LSRSSWAPQDWIGPPLFGALFASTSQREVKEVKMAQSAGGKSMSESISIIGSRVLYREALANSIGAEFECPVETFPDLESWESRSSKPIAAIVLIDDAEGQTYPEVISALQQAGNGAPVIVFTDAEDASDVAETLRRGGRGHVLSTMPLSVALKVIRLVIAGGVFVPADTIIKSDKPRANLGLGRLSLAPRQLAVLEALRKGKSNKQIAHDLALSEASVKAHLRGIMKQLEVRNRTEAVVKMDFISRSPVRRAKCLGKSGAQDSAILNHSGSRTEQNGFFTALG
jgi:DNA-binding NarL/FixJ family response regulator